MNKLILSLSILFFNINASANEDFAKSIMQNFSKALSKEMGGEEKSKKEVKQKQKSQAKASNNRMNGPGKKSSLMTLPKVGQKVNSWSNSQCWPAIINEIHITQKSTKYLISYPGWDSSYNEWVLYDNIDACN